MVILKYKRLFSRTNKGTKENPVWKESFADIEMPWSEKNEEIAKKEAYNGEYTIEDDGQPTPEATPSQDERISDLEEALDMLLSGVTE